MLRQYATAMMGALALAGCDRAPEPAPAPSPTPTEGDAAREPVSIIRPDIEVEREAPPLSPLEARVSFAQGGTELPEDAEAVLAPLLESPQMAAGGVIVLRGHTDSTGGDEANLRAAQRRAEAVRDWLVAHGVEEERISVIAIGEQNPVAPNALPDGSPNEPGRAANRRVDLTVAVPPGTPAAQATGKSETLVGELTR